MRISRIYINKELNIDKEIDLDERSFQYAIKVLRLREGATVALFNGDGGEYIATLFDVAKKHARIKIFDFKENNTESPLSIHLGIGISKGERMDFAIQKAVELGVTEITPLFTEHCVVSLDEKRIKKKMLHWQGIIISACEQSGRSVLPVLNTTTTLTKWTKSNDQICLVFDPLAEKSLNEVKPKNDFISLVIGPEGGFSAKELSELENNSNFHAVKFGPRILRTETAVISSITALQLLWGDLLK